VKQLQAALACNNVVRLSLAGCSLDHAAVASVLDAVAGAPGLEELVLASNRLPLEVCEAVAGRLRACRSMRVLDLTGCGLQEPGAVVLLGALQPGKDPAGRLIAAAAPIQQLNLGYNPICWTDPDRTAALLRGASPTLRHLDLTAHQWSTAAVRRAVEQSWVDLDAGPSGGGGGGSGGGGGGCRTISRQDGKHLLQVDGHSEVQFTVDETELDELCAGVFDDFA